MSSVPGKSWILPLIQYSRNSLALNFKFPVQVGGGTGPGEVAYMFVGLLTRFVDPLQVMAILLSPVYHVETPNPFSLPPYLVVILQNFLREIYGIMTIQECIPVGSVLPASVAISRGRGGGRHPLGKHPLPYCMLGYTPSLPRCMLGYTALLVDRWNDACL